jgi:Domain of unknown function (DUF1918)
MQAAVGDRLHVRGNVVGHPERTARSSVSWPAAHRIPAARRWLSFGLCAARVRWSAARLLVCRGRSLPA